MPSSMTVDQAKASVRQLEKICSIRPTVENLTNLCNCYFLLGDLESAIPLAEQAYQKDPHNPAVATNLALVWKDYGDHDGAHNLLRIVCEELESENQFSRLAWAESLLRKGQWDFAWPIYDSSRFSKEQAALTAGIPTAIREWNGTRPIHRLAVIDEGGIGDSLTYSRYLPVLTDEDIDWIYLPFPELKGFYERASWCGASRLARTGERMDISHWTTTQSLPARLGSTPLTVPKHREFFKPYPKLVEKYKLRNQRDKKPVLGLCWSGGEMQNTGRRIHSLTEGQAMRLVCRTDHMVTWVNLQHDMKMPEPVVNVKITTWEDLAGLMTNLDAVVSVETGPMCLAHALGKKLIVLLSGNSDWKFMESGSGPFYPEAITFRNISAGIEKALDETIEFIKKNWDEKKRLMVVG